MTLPRVLMAVALLATACSGAQPPEPQPTPQIVYVTPAPSQEPTPTPDDMPTSRPATPTPELVQPTPEVIYVTPEPEPSIDIDAVYMEFLGEFTGTSTAITEALGAIGDGDFDEGLRLGSEAVDDGLSWARFHAPEDCYSRSFDLYYESLIMFDVSFDRIRRSIDAFDAAGIERATEEMEEATDLIVQSGENPDSC